jgi:hypothetical protein
VIIMQRSHLSAMLLVAILTGCATHPATAPTTPVPITPPSEARNAPVARVPVAPAASAKSAPAQIAAALPFAGNVIYMCVTEDAGQRRQTAIELSPKVLELCRRHPEMGPCQYERNVCRSAGGRVFAADGREITAATEAEYDKKVYRVRFRGD